MNSMTQEELDALPIDEQHVLWTEDDEACSVVDANGCGWRIGWYEGVRYKARLI